MKAILVPRYSFLPPSIQYADGTHWMFSCVILGIAIKADMFQVNVMRGGGQNPGQK